ncbi:MAG: VCBS repeat-containing protein [Mycobacteriales bacterium]
MPAHAIIASPVSPTFSTFRPSSAPASFVIKKYAGDLNGDGNLDIITGRYNAGFGVELGLGNGTFSAMTVINNGGIDAYAPAVGDIDGDGHGVTAVVRPFHPGAGRPRQ